MAGHTGFGRRNAREIAFLNRRVTIAAIDSQLADVVAVAEWKGLFTHHLSLGHIRRAFNGQKYPKRQPLLENPHQKCSLWQTYLCSDEIVEAFK